MIKTINGDPLKKGNTYTRQELGIKYPKSLKSEVVINGENLLFVTIKNKEMYQNELHHDGLVFQTNDKMLAKYGVKNTLPKKLTHIFVRYFEVDSFLYLGELEYTVRYDINRNKLIIKADKHKKPRATAKRRTRRGT